MLRCFRLAAVLLALAMFTGCRAPPPPEPLAVVTVPPPLVVAPAQPLQPGLVQGPMPPSLARWPGNWLEGWLSLQSWCRYNGLAPPLRVASNPGVTYAIQTVTGRFQVKLDHRAVRFDDVECWLAYAPQWVRGEPCVYARDAQKTLQPLAILSETPPLAGRTVVLDPGHGGRDGGTRSVYNRWDEKHYTLDWAIRLHALLTAHGWNVVLTRSQDLEVSLAERVAIADRANADLFVSLHFNSGPAGQDRSGLETYCLTPAGLPSNLVRDPEEDTMQAYPNNAFDVLNLQWAFRLHRALLAATGAEDHGIRRARFMAVLRGQSRPAVLLEAGYLSHPQEARKIAVPAYRQQLAGAVARALD